VSTWFAADQHFGHARLLELSAVRDAAFPTVAEMNARLVHNWNAVVQPDDTVWVLGDFGMHGEDATIELVSQLVGTTVRRRVHRGRAWQADVPVADSAVVIALRGPIAEGGKKVLGEQPSILLPGFGAQVARGEVPVGVHSERVGGVALGLLLGRLARLARGHVRHRVLHERSLGP